MKFQSSLRNLDYIDRRVSFYCFLCIVVANAPFAMFFSGVHFNTSQIHPTIEQIDQSFGATHPGGNTIIGIM